MTVSFENYQDRDRLLVSSIWYRFRIHMVGQRPLEKLPGDADERVLNRIEEVHTEEFRERLDDDV